MRWFFPVVTAGIRQVSWPDNCTGGDRFRLRMSLQEKRAEDAGMISLTMPRKKISAKVNNQRDLALAA